MKPLRGPKWPIIRSIVTKGLGRVAASLGTQDAARIVLAEALAEKKRKIRKASAGDGSGHNQQVKRYANERARALKKHLVRNKRVGMLDRSTLIRDRTPSPLLDGLDPNRGREWKRIISRRYKKEYPRLDLGGLNFLDDPIGTMIKLQQLSAIDGSEVNAHIDFTDRYCVDIGAYLVVAEIWHQLSPVFRGGKMSPSVQKVLDAVGLGNDLNITLFGQIGHDSVWPFEIRRRRPRGTTKSATAHLRPQGREQLNDDLIELIDKWLAVASDHADNVTGVTWRLTGDGKANIANMVGELLDNAERHSSAGHDGDWSMAAFMAKRSENGEPESMRCYLAFLSVGRSIADAIATAPAKPREYCEKYARLHHRCGRSKETLMTIAALQDGVTSKPEAVAADRGGTGLQDALDFIGLLAGVPDPNANARMTIVSGKSCIRLRHPILVGRRDGKGRRVQWCNESNDPGRPPDREIAFDLPAHFAGTLVSMAFTLDAGIFSPTGGLDGQSDD